MDTPSWWTRPLSVGSTWRCLFLRRVYIRPRTLHCYQRPLPFAVWKVRRVSSVQLQEYIWLGVWMFLYAYYAMLNSRYAILYARYAILYACYAILYARYAILYACYAILYARYAILYACYTISYACYSILYAHYAMQFACFITHREVLASPPILNMPSRAHWKECSLSVEEETSLAQQFRDTFQPYDFTDTDDWRGLSKYGHLVHCAILSRYCVIMHKEVHIV